MDVWNPQYLLYKYERERKRTSTNYMEIKISTIHHVYLSSKMRYKRQKIY